MGKLNGKLVDFQTIIFDPVCFAACLMQPKSQQLPQRTQLITF